MGVQVLQHGLDGADAFCQPPIQGRLGQRGTLATVGGDDFHHGLSLGQRHAAMLQRAAGELTRPCRGCARGDKGFQQAVRHSGTAVD